MAAPNPRRQKEARQRLEKLFHEPHNVWIIHYSCESFYDRADSPRVTSIAVRGLDSAQTSSFSIHQMAERKGVPLKEISERYNELEREMLDEFFELVGTHRGKKFLHWNMRDINYGFQAIEHRYRVLGGTPQPIQDQDKFDLPRILIDIYGVGFASHPRLPSIMDLNNIEPKDFLSGQQEADAFNRGDYVALHQSTLRKVDIISNIASRAHDRSLRTKTTWWELHGGSIREVISWISQHPFFVLIASLASIVALGVALIY